MPHIDSHHERFVEEDILGLLGRNTMPLPVLLNVRLIPVKSNAFVKRILPGHVFSI